MQWFVHFNNSNSVNKTAIDKDTIKLVRYFIASNSAAQEFDSPWFRELLTSTSIKLPCSKTFSTVILKSVFEKLNGLIESKLNQAESICLISDIWTNRQMKDFMGLAVNMIDSYFEKSTLVIGMCIMPGSHNAENIKLAIESIVNRFSFDKSKIHGNYK